MERKLLLGLILLKITKCGMRKILSNLQIFCSKKNYLITYILVCSPEKSHIAKKIITESNKNYFIDCSNKDLQGVILAIKNSDFFLEIIQVH